MFFHTLTCYEDTYKPEKLTFSAVFCFVFAFTLIFAPKKYAFCFAPKLKMFGLKSTVHTDI